jgi:ribosomal protein L11 methyltransferase
MIPDRWLELRVRSAVLPPEVLVEGLLDLGGRAVWEEDGWHVTHLPDSAPPAGAVDPQPYLRRAFPDQEPGTLEVETRWQAQEDWAEFWKQGLGARRISPRLVVAPTWVDTVREGDEQILVLDPGMAFGTAEHGTTRGCLRLLDDVVAPGDRVLDVGSGSGILGIAAALLGASTVLGLELDEWAVDAARENVDRNGARDRVTIRQVCVTPGILQAAGRWDGVVSNMETGRLRPLLAGLVDAAVPGGWIVLSGILDTEFDTIREEMASLGAGCEEVDVDGEWRSGLFRRPPDAL